VVDDRISRITGFEQRTSVQAGVCEVFFPMSAPVIPFGSMTSVKIRSMRLSASRKIIAAGQSRTSSTSWPSSLRDSTE
jgi:hypothetical protein